MPLDPHARSLLEQIEAQGLPRFEEMTVPQAREIILGFKELQAEPPPIARAEDRTIPDPAGDIPIRVYTPDAELPAPLLVYFHGGGWTIGNIDVADRPCRALAHATRGVVVSVEYRLGPEHKFPSAIDDCYAATRWVAEHAAELGADPGRAFDTPSYRDNADGYLLTRGAMRWFWGHYLADEADGRHWRASALRAPDLSGLPPALIATREFDPLRDQGEAYAERLRAAGVPVTVHRYDSMIHGFFWMSLTLPQAQQLLDEIAAALDAALRPMVAR